MQQSVRVPQHGRLLGVEAARGVAALLVVLYHGQGVLAHPDLAGASLAGGLFRFGHAGVEFFFVLSGFIILRVHRADIGQAARCPTYLWKRVTRIYPLFWAVLAIYAAKAAVSGKFDTGYFITSALLLPQPPYPMMIQAWTLEHEIFFYVLFGLLILNRTVGLFAFSYWAIGIVAASLAGHAHVPGDVLQSPYNLLFFVGLGVAALLQHRNIPAPRLAILGGGLCFLAAGLTENAGLTTPGTPLSVGLFGASSALLILGLVSAERMGALRLGGIGLVLGRISYPLYLSHSIVISVFAAVATRFPIRGQGALLLFAYTAIACAVAALLHRFAEVPLQSALHKIRARVAGPHQTSAAPHGVSSGPKLAEETSHS